MQDLKDKISIARGVKKADLVFKNAKIVDVFSNKIIKKDLAVDNGEIIGIGLYQGKEEVDLKGKYICPSLIDSHVHIESSMVSPCQLAKLLLVNGVTTIIADPHEIANVLGLEGIEYIIKASKDLDLDIRIMLPSCVPATFFENSGALLDYKELEKFKDCDKVLGLGELMNYVGLLNEDNSVLEKIQGFKDKIIDGHAPGLMGNDLNAYAIAGIKTDHECSNIQEMEDRISKGMYVQIREGTSAKNADALTKAINKDNISRCLFCTDDKHPKDLLEKGSVNENIKIAIKNGIDPIDAIKIASINPATCYNLKKKGALAPGYEANFIVLDSLEDFVIDSVYVKGKKVSQNAKLLIDIEDKAYIKKLDNVNIYDYKLEDFQIKMKSTKANIIGIHKNNLLTTKLVEDVKLEGGVFVASEDYQKIVVIERHKGLKSMGKGIIKGFGIRNGAFASTIAHDSHNLVIVGDNDPDMFLAMKTIKKINGGISVVQNGKVLASLPLEIAGLMSRTSIEDTNKKLEEVLYQILYKLKDGKDDLDPILTLGFMTLPVIPEIKLTDKGLFDVNKFDFIDIEA
ncbi:MAG: adenine deaminase [Peptoniphilaceae bacterium]|nr:adenine deaminase [Peptoniphilaceae bacterium]MDY6018731.1 adenine deaminase [Anaerococcus sp.]